MDAQIISCIQSNAIGGLVAALIAFILSQVLIVMFRNRSNEAKFVPVAIILSSISAFLIVYLGFALYVTKYYPEQYIAKKNTNWECCK